MARSNIAYIWYTIIVVQLWNHIKKRYFLFVFQFFFGQNGHTKMRKGKEREREEGMMQNENR